jgi:general secretion pathway protein F
VNRYRYQALTHDGELKAGIYYGTSQTNVRESLRQMGWWPISVLETRSIKWRRFQGKRPDGLNEKQITVFFRGLSALLDAGMGLDTALTMMSRRQKDNVVARMSDTLLRRIKEGQSLAQSMSETGCFSSMPVGLVRAGETSGTLGKTVLRLAEMMARGQALRTEIISALIYPGIILATAIFCIGVIIIFVIPEFMPLFASSGRMPPLAFRFLMAVSQFLVDWGWLVLCAGILCGLATRARLEDPVNRLRWDEWKLRIPIIRYVLHDIEAARFCRTLGTMLTADIALPLGLSLAAEAVSNSAISAAIRQVATDVREGQRLIDRLAGTGKFSDQVLDFLRIGEETGRLGEVLLRQADSLEVSVRTSTSRLLSIMVPVITLILGLVVAGIVTTLLMALLSVNDLAAPSN